MIKLIVILNIFKTSLYIYNIVYVQIVNNNTALIVIFV